MPGDGAPQLSDLAALERFVVENDDLAELEARIGRFGELICQWAEDEEPEAKEVLVGVGKKLDELWKRLEGVPEALRPILDRYKNA